MRGKGGNEPVRVVFVQDLLGRHDLVDGANLGTGRRVPPRTLKLLRDYPPIVSDSSKIQDTTHEQKNAHHS